MTIDLDKLEALAREATPGPWVHKAGGQNPAYPREETYPIVRAGSIELAVPDREADAAFIAAVNPAVVLELVQRLRAAEDGGPGYHAEAQMSAADSEALASWADGQAMRRLRRVAEELDGHEAAPTHDTLRGIVRDLAASDKVIQYHHQYRDFYCAICYANGSTRDELQHAGSCPYGRAVEAMR